MLSFTELEKERAQLRDAFANLDGGVTGPLEARARSVRARGPAVRRTLDSGRSVRAKLAPRVSRRRRRARAGSELIPQAIS